MSKNQKIPQRGKLSRRTLLKGVAGLSAVAALPGCTSPATAPTTAAALRSRAAIRLENLKPGSQNWMLQKTGIEPGTKYRCPWIEGYCSRTSVRAGETLDIFVSTNPASEFNIELYRMGFYGGAGGRLVREWGPLKGRVQSDPAISKNRLRECRWEPALSLKIPPDWLSGVYLGKLTARKDGWQSYIIFIVRDNRPADFIFQCSDTTWQAYNRWPSQFSLYDDGKSEWYWGPGVDVSFDRPYGKYCQIMNAPLSTGSGEWFLWEFPIAYWLESQGFDITYISNLDTHADPANLMRAKGLLSVGHDEYYSIEMFDQLRAAIGRGLNVAFFSGNTCCGRIDLKPNSAGVANRQFSRTDFYGPRDEAEIKRFPAMALLPHTSPNANLLVGARSIAPVTGGADWVCQLPDHWLFEGTNMKAGEGIPGLVGWEWHGDPAQTPGLEVVASAPTQDKPGKLNGGIFTATLYPGPKQNLVFNASSCWWGDGLSAPPGYVRPSVYTSPQGPDPRAQRITANVLRRMQATNRL